MPVKLNAEQKEAISFKGREYTYVSSGKRGIHQLAYGLLSGRPSYPSYVYLNEELEVIGVTKGFKPADAFMIDLKAKVNFVN